MVSRWADDGQMLTVSTQAQGRHCPYPAVQVATCPGWVVCVDSQRGRMWPVSFAPSLPPCQGWRHLGAETTCPAVEGARGWGVEVEEEEVVIPLGIECSVPDKSQKTQVNLVISGGSYRRSSGVASLCFPLGDTNESIATQNGSFGARQTWVGSWTHHIAPQLFHL